MFWFQLYQIHCIILTFWLTSGLRRNPRALSASSLRQLGRSFRGGRLRGAAASHRAEAARGGGGGLAHRAARPRDLQLLQGQVLHPSIRVSTTFIHSSLPSISISFYGSSFCLDKLSAEFCVRKVPTTESIRDPPHWEYFLGPDESN